MESETFVWNSANSRSSLSVSQWVSELSWYEAQWSPYHRTADTHSTDRRIVRLCDVVGSRVVACSSNLRSGRHLSNRDDCRTEPALESESTSCGPPTTSVLLSDRLVVSRADGRTDGRSDLVFSRDQEASTAVAHWMQAWITAFVQSLSHALVDKRPVPYISLRPSRCPSGTVVRRRKLCISNNLLSLSLFLSAALCLFQTKTQ